MPELPEVETIRAQLAVRIVGKRIETVRCRGSRVVRRGDTEAFLSWRPAEINGVLRIGKFLALRIAGGGAVVLHLGMSGYLALGSRDESLAPHSQIIFELADGQRLSLIDPRTFGEVFYAPTWDLAPPYTPFLAHLGVDLMEDLDSVVERVGRRFGEAKRSVKSFIMDQKMVAGLGNMYADEALYRAGIHPEEPCWRLGSGGLRVVIGAIQRVLDEALACGGSTFADRSYRNLDGEGAYFDQLLVYQRCGHPCLLCWTSIARVRFQGRYSHFCPRCQRRLS